MLRPAPRRLSSLVSLGAIVGFSAGLFGIGGGVVLVPLLLRVFRFPLATAAGTSVAAILPAALTGGITYALQGFVDLQAALFLMIGIVLGAQLGSYLLARVNQNLIKTTFMIFLVLTAASLWVVVPNRADSIVFNLYTALALVCVGFISGALSEIGRAHV